MKALEILQVSWSSLEIAKMFISTLTPLIIVVLAFRFNKALKQLDKKQWTNQKIIEKRIEIYDKIVPKLNDILCFYCYVGNWKEIKPKNVIRLKRELDKDLNIYAPLFSDSLTKKYCEFIHLCFKSFSGWGLDAKIRSLFENRQAFNAEWNNEWIDYFDTDDVLKPEIILEKYSELMSKFKEDLIIFQSGYYPGTAAPK
jgi:hypothetical protein